MLGYLRLFLIVLFASGLVFAEEYNCIEHVYPNHSNFPIPACREECVGIAPFCKPNCYDKCPKHSKCVEPEICKCVEGYVKNGSDTNMTCNLIVCPPNSQMVNDTTCKCLDGYKEDNVEMNAILQSCEPICKSNCPANSFCASPDNCVCDGGYEIDEMTDDDPPKLKHCKPVCSAECPENSVCVSPDDCKCNPGYSPTTNMSGTLDSCLEDSFTEMHIVIYSFLVCSVIFTIVTVIAMIVICVRKKNPAEVPDTRSWHTSFASYAEYELNEDIYHK